MSNEKLFELGKPCFYVVQADESTFTDLYMKLVDLHTRSIIRMIRGKKTETPPHK